MKLSEKGFNKSVNNLIHLRKLEFEPSDFEDCVVLTLEEAKKLYLDLFALSDMQPIPVERFYAWKKFKDQIEEQKKRHEAK